MPVIPQEGSDMAAELAKQKPQEQGEKKLASADHHKANLGPVKAEAEDLGQPASKEELKQRAAELNKES